MSNQSRRSGGRELGASSRRKVEQVLAAARRLFTEHGFGATSMDAVASLAGVGKATVYAHFGSKEELFAAVIESEGRVHSVALSAHRGEAPASVLERFGFDAFDLLVSPTTIAIYRAVAAEAVRLPHLGRVFFTRGPATLIDRFASYLGEAMDKGELRRAPPRQAATQFFGMLCGDEQVRALLGVGRTISRKERRMLVKGGVDAFLRAYRPSD